MEGEDRRGDGDLPELRSYREGGEGKDADGARCRLRAVHPDVQGMADNPLYCG